MNSRLTKVSLADTPPPEYTKSCNDVKRLTVKEMAPELQPREKAERYGINTLSLAELLAIILRTGMPGLPITDMMRNLLYDNDNRLHNLERLSAEQLIKNPGIGPTKRLQLQAIFELIKRYNLEQKPERPQIKCSNDIYEVMRDRIGNLPHEEIWIITLNQSHHVTSYYKITSGGHRASVFDMRMILKRAILDEAASIVLCHNHPSGNLRPSSQDDAITRMCNEGAKAVDIRLIDHLIITSFGFYSYRDENRLS